MVRANRIAATREYRLSYLISIKGTPFRSRTASQLSPPSPQPVGKRGVSVRMRPFCSRG